MEQLLEELLEASQPYTKNGKLADYIPELLKADPSALGIYVMRPDGKRSWAGDCTQKFTIQSVVKPILLLLALMDNGIDAVRAQVGVEATGKPFDAINAINTNEKALYSEHLNPMVNMGAILMCTLIHGDTYQKKFERLLDLTRKLADNPDIVVDEAVYQSEKATGSKNRALAYLLKTYGLIDCDVKMCWTAISGPVPFRSPARIWPAWAPFWPIAAALPALMSVSSPPSSLSMSTPFC